MNLDAEELPELQKEATEAEARQRKAVGVCLTALPARIPSLASALETTPLSLSKEVLSSAFEGARLYLDGLRESLWKGAPVLIDQVSVPLTLANARGQAETAMQFLYFVFTKLMGVLKLMDDRTQLEQHLTKLLLASVSAKPRCPFARCYAKFVSNALTEVVFQPTTASVLADFTTQIAEVRVPELPIVEAFHRHHCVIQTTEDSVCRRLLEKFGAHCEKLASESKSETKEGDVKMEEEGHTGDIPSEVRPFTDELADMVASFSAQWSNAAGSQSPSPVPDVSLSRRSSAYHRRTVPSKAIKLRGGRRNVDLDEAGFSETSEEEFEASDTESAE